MVIEIKLLTAKKETPEGFPLAVQIAHQNKRKTKNIAFCKEKHFIQDGKTISEKHPDYDVLAPILMELKIRARKLILNGYNDVEKVYQELFAVDFSQIGFIDFAEGLIAEMKDVAEKVGKHDLKAKNKLLGNVRCYENVIAQFENFGKNVTLQNLDYSILMAFKNYNTGIGNSKATVHLYLRTLRAIYNKGILKHKFADEKPFTGVFDGLKTRSYDSKKKYLDRDALGKLEQLDLKSAKQKYVDLFLLQFYFGGCDLIDLYYLKKRQIRKGRIVFDRTKTNTGTRIDLKVHPKAQAILDKYTGEADWLFPWKKENESYITFRGNYQRDIVLVQKAEKIEVSPDDGNLGIKVARHTFANLAKTLNIDTDVIRELMGHERDDVDNYYKDKYPEAVRDKALFDIIG
ncbi:tyrosine-type recombinase/integrase [Flavobacterium aestivum]|uniref:tyrosine-type recombinase/integrase n=1 Tax=Flavobacterium aestivum TaxID=3003257 RepID=UPI00248269FE|nr:phage integrase SAM-like domain-containing protein [Flavobacterium aestivum]